MSALRRATDKYVDTIVVSTIAGEIDGIYINLIR